jgi:hypothetical protein
MKAHGEALENRNFDLLLRRGAACPAKLRAIQGDGPLEPGDFPIQFPIELDKLG